MRGYKIVARILLMLSVINFVLTAPVVVRQLEVRVIESDDGPVPSNPAPPIDSPSPSPGPGSTAAQSYSLSAGLSSPKDSHVLTSRAPTDPSHPPGFLPKDPSPSYPPGFPPTDPSHPPGFPQIAASPKSPQIITLSSDESGETYSSSSWVPTDSAHGTSHPPGSPQIVALPESPQIVSSSDKSYSSSSWASQDPASPPPWV